MGMGRVNPNTSSGMSGKGGAARPATPTAPQPGMGGKGVGQQPMQTQQAQQPGMGGKGGGTSQPINSNLQQRIQPVAGMGGKGVGGQQPGMPDFAQPYAPQVQPGMSGKGGTQQINPALQPYIGSAIGRPYQQPPQVQPGMGGKGLGQQPQQPQQPPLFTNSYTDFPMFNQTQASSAPVLSPQEQDLAARQAFEAMQAQRQVQQPAVGMGGKGVGRQLPPQAGTLNNSLMGLSQAPVDLAGQRTAFDAANPQPVNNPNDPYAQRFGNLTQQQQNAMQFGDAYYGQPQRMATPAEQAASGLRAAPAPALGSALGALSGLRTPQPVKAPAPRQAAQRALQQLAARNRGRR